MICLSEFFVEGPITWKPFALHFPFFYTGKENIPSGNIHNVKSKRIEKKALRNCNAHILIWGFPKMVGFPNNFWFSYQK